MSRWQWLKALFKQGSMRARRHLALHGRICVLMSTFQRISID
jgi:hypothetical protein